MPLRYFIPILLYVFKDRILICEVSPYKYIKLYYFILQILISFNTFKILIFHSSHVLRFDYISIGEHSDSNI